MVECVERYALQCNLACCRNDNCYMSCRIHCVLWTMPGHKIIAISWTRPWSQVKWMTYNNGLIFWAEPRENSFYLLHAKLAVYDKISCTFLYRLGRVPWLNYNRVTYTKTYWLNVCVWEDTMFVPTYAFGLLPDMLLLSCTCFEPLYV